MLRLLRSFVKSHGHLMPMLLVALVATSYLACGDDDVDVTPAPEDAGLDVKPPRDDGAALDGNAADGNATDGNSTDGTTTDSPADAPADTSDDAPIDGPDDSPSSNG